MRDDVSQLEAWGMVEKPARARAEEEARWATLPPLHPEPILELSIAGEPRYANPAADVAFPDFRESTQERPHPIVQAALTWAWRRPPPDEPWPVVNFHGQYWELVVVQHWEPACLRVFARDVTAHQQLQAQLRQAEDQVALLSSVPTKLAYAVCDPVSFMLANLSFIHAEMEKPDKDLAALREPLAETIEGAQRLKLVLEELRKLQALPAVLKVLGSMPPAHTEEPSDKG